MYVYGFSKIAGIHCSPFVFKLMAWLDYAEIPYEGVKYKRNECINILIISCSCSRRSQGQESSQQAPLCWAQWPHHHRLSSYYCSALPPLWYLSLILFLKFYFHNFCLYRFFRFSNSLFLFAFCVTLWNRKAHWCRFNHWRGGHISCCDPHAWGSL